MHATEPGFTSLTQHNPSTVASLVQRGVQLFREGPNSRPLSGQCVAIWFQMTSTRTRTAFTVATTRLGGTAIPYGPDELQTATGETEDDTARVLGSMLDGIVIRARGSSADLQRLQDQAGVPVVNAMASDEHPTQAICDLATLTLHLGSLTNRSVLYVGEGNNSASALVHAAAATPGLRLRLLVPEGYGLPGEMVEQADRAARAHGGQIAQDHDVSQIEHETDAIYTTRWQTTGTSKPDPQWRDAFEPFRVDESFMQRAPGAIFMHDLPAHRGDEVTAGVLDGPRSVAWDQARMKLYTAMAVLEHTMGRP